MPRERDLSTHSPILRVPSQPRRRSVGGDTDRTCEERNAPVNIATSDPICRGLQRGCAHGSFAQSISAREKSEPLLLHERYRGEELRAASVGVAVELVRAMGSARNGGF